MRNLITKRRGVGLVELLIALSISAILLTATAVAVDASFNAYTANQEQSSLLQQGRMALYRISTSIRTTTEHNPIDPGLVKEFSAGDKITGNGITMIEGQEDDPTYPTLVTYRYDVAKQHLIAQVQPRNQPVKSYILARGVEAFQVSMEPMRSPENLRTGGAYDLMRRATLLITIRTAADTARPSETTGKYPVTLSISVTPRRNSW